MPVDGWLRVVQSEFGGAGVPPGCWLVSSFGLVGWDCAALARLWRAGEALGPDSWPWPPLPPVGLI